MEQTSPRPPLQHLERGWIPAFAGMTGAAARSPIAPDTVSLVQLYRKHSLVCLTPRPPLRRKR